MMSSGYEGLEAPWYIHISLPGDLQAFGIVTSAEKVKTFISVEKVMDYHHLCVNIMLVRTQS